MTADHANTDLARRTILAIVKADTREFVTLEVCDTESELARAHAAIRDGYMCEVFELTPRTTARDPHDCDAPVPGGGHREDCCHLPGSHENHFRATMTAATGALVPVASGRGPRHRRTCSPE
jgi:hypothetical protein